MVTSPPTSLRQTDLLSSAGTGSQVVHLLRLLDVWTPRKWVHALFIRLQKTLTKRRKSLSQMHHKRAEKPVKRRAEAAGFGYTDVIKATQDAEGLTYLPWMAET